MENLYYISRQLQRQLDKPSSAGLGTWETYVLCSSKFHVEYTERKWHCSSKYQSWGPWSITTDNKFTTYKQRQICIIWHILCETDEWQMSKKRFLCGLPTVDLNKNTRMTSLYSDQRMPLKQWFVSCLLLMLCTYLLLPLVNAPLPEIKQADGQRMKHLCTLNHLYTRHCAGFWQADIPVICYLHINTFAFSTSL